MGNLVRDTLAGLYYAGVALFVTCAWRSLKGTTKRQSRVTLAWGGVCGGLVAALVLFGRVALTIPSVPTTVLALLLGQWFFAGFTLGAAAEMIYRRTPRKALQ
jgi:hypothetical protein